MKTTINIDDYLSEEDKIEIARNEFAKTVRESLMKDFDKYPTKRLENYERIMTNAVYYYLENNVDELLGTDSKKFIAEKVQKVLKDNKFDYSVFRSKSAWEKEDSLAQQYLIEAVKDNRDIINSKVLDRLQEIDTEDLQETVNEIIYEVINNRLKV